MASVYPKDYSMKVFEEVYKSKQVSEGSIIKVDSGAKKCVGIFKGIRPGFKESFWQLYVHPQYWIEGRDAVPSKNDSSDFSIISIFPRGVTVLASSNSTWDQKTGLVGSESPPKRRSSTEIPSMSRTSSQSSTGLAVSPINPSDFDEGKSYWGATPKSSPTNGLGPQFVSPRSSS